MNNFNLLKYLSKWKYLIFAVCVLGAVLVYMYAMYNQEYTASTIISYTNVDASRGKTPSGDDIDVSEIYSATVITNVLEDLKLDIGADAIRSKCHVESIIPPDEEIRKQAILEAGEEYEYFPTDYVVSFSVGSEYSRDFAKTVLDTIIKYYFEAYGEKYINQQTLPDNNLAVVNEQYDYIERAEILDSWANNILDYLGAKKETQPGYRSATTGYSFNDLYEVYKGYLDYDIPEIYALILEQNITVDRQTCIWKYQNEISNLKLDVENMQSKIDNLHDLIAKYSDKNKEGINYNPGEEAEAGEKSSNFILKDIYQDRDKSNAVDSETTYDSLVNEYVSLEAEKEKIQVDIDHKQKLVDTFKTSEMAIESGNTDTIADNIKTLGTKLGDMYSIVSDTVDEYNQYVGSYNLSTLSGISTSEKINVKMYIILAIIIFFFGGCIGAIVLGRSKEFLDYIMYTDRKTGIPNRAMCDLEIERYASDKLKDNFVFVLIKLENLRYVNNKGGRDAGDALLKAFGRLLKRAATSYGFVGYNGSEQFICLFEDCTLERAEDFKHYLEELVQYHNNQNPATPMDVTIYLSETHTEEIYDMRKLMGVTFRKGASSRPKTDNDTAEKETKTDNGEDGSQKGGAK